MPCKLCLRLLGRYRHLTEFIKVIIYVYKLLCVLMGAGGVERTLKTKIQMSRVRIPVVPPVSLILPRLVTKLGTSKMENSFEGKFLIKM